MNFDKRANKLAELIVNHSLYINSNDYLIVFAEDSFKDFANLIGDYALKKGADFIYESFNLEKRKESILRDDHDEFKRNAERFCNMIDEATCWCSVKALSNPKYLQGIDSFNYDKIFWKPVVDKILGTEKIKGIKWNAVVYPCESEALNANIPYNKYSDMIYNACFIDWEELSKQMRMVKDKFDNADSVRILVPGQTSLEFSLSGRGGQIDDGHVNMPGGEVFYGPLEDSANGRVYFPDPILRDGNLTKGISLEYEDGLLINYDALENFKFLKSKVSMNGVDRIGEFGIGFNPQVNKLTQLISLDEKINGSIHLAVGFSYGPPMASLDNGGGLNKADIHWDLILNLKKYGGKLFVDSELVQENGIWKF